MVCLLKRWLEAYKMLLYYNKQQKELGLEKWHFLRCLSMVQLCFISIRWK